MLIPILRRISFIHLAIVSVDVTSLKGLMVDKKRLFLLNLTGCVLVRYVLTHCTGHKSGSCGNEYRMRGSGIGFLSCYVYAVHQN